MSSPSLQENKKNEKSDNGNRRRRAFDLEESDVHQTGFEMCKRGFYEELDVAPVLMTKMGQLWDLRNLQNIS